MAVLTFCCGPNAGTQIDTAMTADSTARRMESARTTKATSTGRGQASLTFSPLGPFGPCPISNVTACPSRRSSNAVCWQAKLGKKYSEPSPAKMKPKPLSLTSRLMVPFIDAMLCPCYCVSDTSCVAPARPRLSPLSPLRRVADTRDRVARLAACPTHRGLHLPYGLVHVTLSLQCVVACQRAGRLLDLALRLIDRPGALVLIPHVKLPKVVCSIRRP